MVDLAAYIEQSNRATTQEEAFALFRQVVAGMGLSRCVLAGASNDTAFRERYGITDSAPILLSDYPEHWVRHYLERGYIAFDPVFSSIQSRWSPVVWGDLPEIMPLHDTQKQVMDEAKEIGLCNGVSIPLHAPNGDAFVISMATECRDGDADLRQNLGQLRVIAAQLVFSLSDIWKASGAFVQMPVLTPRERECVQWAAVGKSAWETGQILNISEATVRFHLSNAFNRLGASNRIAAIVRATRLGLITI